MKILVFTHTFPFELTDATANFMYNYASGLNKIGHEVIVFVPYHQKVQLSQFQKIKVQTFKYIFLDKFHQLGYGNTLENDQKLKWFVYFLAPFYFVFGFLSLYRIVKREKIDIIHAHWIIPNGFIAALVSQITGVPLFVTLPGSDVYMMRKNILLRIIGLYSARVSKRIISNSPQLLRDSHLVGDIISYPVFLNLSKRPIHKKITLATGGRLVEKKGIELIRKEIPTITVLTGLTIQKLREQLLSVDIFIALSIRDRSGNLDDASVIVLEAMAAGCAVVVSDLPGYAAIIKNGRNGYLIPSHDSVAIHGVIRKLSRSRRLREKVGECARDTIKKYFTPEKIASRYFELFRRYKTE